MKRLFFAVVVLAVLGAVPVFAQTIDKDHESEYYYHNVGIEKIYEYRKGYILQYRKGVNQMARLYLPYEWFHDAGGKGELVTLPAGTNWPSLTVYYKGGEFSHVRLYVHKSKAHVTWGGVPMATNIDDRFEGVESVQLEF